MIIAVFLVIGILALALAVHFGKKYTVGGVKKDKYICVCCSVTSCVFIVTAIQVLLMFP